MLILVKLLAKYIIIIYALGWYMKSSQNRSKVIPQSKFPAELGVENGWAIPN